jgi:hypothetical protein
MQVDFRGPERRQIAHGCHRYGWFEITRIMCDCPMKRLFGESRSISVILVAPWFAIDV